MAAWTETISPDDILQLEPTGGAAAPGEIPGECFTNISTKI